MMERKLLILYGSETGSARDTSDQIWQGARRRRITVRICAMDDFDASCLIDWHTIIFVCSTTGCGEPPDNMRKFWRLLLQRSLPRNLLSGVNFVVLGLGASTYQKFNFTAKKLFRRLVQLSAKPFMEIGLADEKHQLGSDAVIVPWLSELWNKIDEIMPLPYGLCIIPEDTLLPSKYHILWTDKNDHSIDHPMNGMTISTEYGPSNPCLATVVQNTRVTADDHFQETRLIKLGDIEDISYDAGDVLYCYPQNLPEFKNIFVESINQNLIQKLDDPFSVEANIDGISLPSSFQLPHPCTLRQCIDQFWDIQSVTKRSFFKKLIPYASSDLEREKLEELTSSEGIDDLYDYCDRPRRTISETLRDFPVSAAAIPLDYLFDMLPVIKPRAFSIASIRDPLEDGVDILVAVVKYKTNIMQPRLGLCSTWLSRTKQGDKVPIWIRPGMFRVPKTEKPCIFIGPGTGIAPIRSFILKRVRDGMSRNVLFFGCRNKSKDFYFQSFWEELEARGSLTLFVAVSRADDESKTYVQHLIAQPETAAYLWKLIDVDGAFIFLSGSSNQMPQNVIEALESCAVKYGNLTPDKSKEYFDILFKNNRFQMETWS